MSATGLMSSFTAWLSALGSSSSTFVLESTAGFHQGVRLELEPGDFRIGSRPGADIVLRDAGIAAEHAILRVGPRSMRAPVDLTIGEARLRISIERAQASAPTPVEPGDARARPRIPAAILIAVALLLAVPALGLAALRPAAPKADAMTSVAPFNVADGHGERIAGLHQVEAAGDETLSMKSASRLLADLPAADRQFVQHCLSTRPGISVREAIAELGGCDRQPPPNPGPGPAANAEDAGRKLTERLNVSGLTGLRVTAGGGQVVVTGSITKQQTDAWTEAQQWFDAAYHGHLVLVANVTPTDAKKPMPVVNVQAVWFGERPYIITAEGNRYYKGAYLDNGWTIKDIADGRILLAKDGETLALVYRQ